MAAVCRACWTATSNNFFCKKRGITAPLFAYFSYLYFFLFESEKIMDSFEDFDVLVKEYLKDQRMLNELREKTVKKLCLILAYQKKEELFKHIDGYSSLAVYAEKRLGVNRTLAYEYAKVGEKFYNSANKEIQEIADAFSPSLLIELLRVSDEHIISAYRNKMITAYSTARELREFAESAKD